MKPYKYKPEELAFMEDSCVPFAVYQFVDKRVVTLALSNGFREVFGYDDKNEAYWLMDNDMYRDTHPDDVARIADAAYRFATEGGKYEVVYRTRIPEGSDYKIVHAQGKHVLTETGVQVAVVFYTDEGAYTSGENGYESELNENLNKALHAESIAQTTHYDQLTGLPSMSYFFQLAEAGRKRMEENGEVAVMLFADLNGMKGFNRKHGFAEGDALIRAFAKVLASEFGNENCSRFGQDHFAIYTSENDIESRIRRVFVAAEKINDGTTLFVRFGIYSTSMGYVDAGTAYDRAKTAGDSHKSIYASSFSYFNSNMLADLEKQQYVIENLDRAIEENWIQVFHQPIVRASNGRVCEEEALARWIDPEHGMLSPADFIPVLEEEKLVYKLDLHVLDQILDKMRILKEKGLYIVPESLNLSRADFETCDIVEEIRQRVDASGFGRDKITIEITESIIGSDFDFMKEQVERFRELGFQVWMDDFGSGYSSLDVLQSIQFDLIKFDMRFMENFGEGPQTQVIMTELVKMAIGLGIETVAEGVETEEQAEFLREIGCSKLQGYLYCRPIPLYELLSRYDEGRQIGFENPAETDYYAAIGSVNLYDMAAIGRGDEGELSNYFDTLPMAIIESGKDTFMLTRCNSTYRDFSKRIFDRLLVGVELEYSLAEGMKGSGFLDALRQCALTGEPAIIDEELGDGSTAHAMIRKIAKNPVTGVVAIVVAVLGVINRSDEDGTTFEHIARALSADYEHLYYVDLDTDVFIEYSSNDSSGKLNVEKRGVDFFNTARSEALDSIHKPDQKAFLQAFNKENIVSHLDEHGSFTVSYRLLINKRPTYVMMKAVRMQDSENKIVIGVSNVDVQMRQKATLDRLREEQASFERMRALAGNLLSMYAVDFETGHYVEYNASSGYEKLGLAKEGDDFFGVTEKESQRAVHPDDLDMFMTEFSEEKVKKAIEERGSFQLRYRLVIDGETMRINLRAAQVEDRKDGKKTLIFGMSTAEGMSNEFH